MVPEESKQPSPQIPKQPNTASNALQSPDCNFSPGFRSAAALAGWDEEALLFASLVVEDTPDRRLKQKKRSDLELVDTPRTSSRKKRKTQRTSSIGIQIPVLDLDEIETTADSKKKNVEIKVSVDDEKKKKKIDECESAGQRSDEQQCPKSALPCMDRLREELSCGICLEICFEPSSTPCGHSFCKKCLRSAADKCGKKCPKCRQPISNGRSCTVNTVLWNTIQLLFPQEVQARKAADFEKTECQIPVAAPSRHSNNDRNRTVEDDQQRRRRADGGRRRGGRTWSLDEDVALAQRLQRQDFMEAFNQGSNSSSTSTREQRQRRGGTWSQDEDAALARRLQRQDFMDAFNQGRNIRTSTREHRRRS